MPAQMHSPPEREKTTLTRQLLEKYNSNSIPPSYVDTEEKPLISVGIGGVGNRASYDGHENNIMSYENTIETD